MKISQIIVGAIVVIAVTTICGTEGLPRPQLVEVDGFAFNGPVSGSGTLQKAVVPPIDGPESTPPVDTPTPPSTTLISVPESTTTIDTLTDASETTPTPNTPAIDSTSPQPVTQSPELVQCRQNCRFRVTSEFNPVCGSDRSVYTNPGMLNCVKGCGHDVDHAYFGPCTSQIRG